MSVTYISNDTLQSNELDGNSPQLISEPDRVLPAPSPTELCEEFLKTIIQRGWVEIRAIKKNESRPRQHFFWGNYVGCGKYADHHRERGFDVYFGVCSRGNNRSGTAENCIHVWTLWADLDFKNDGEARSRERLEKYPLKPSIVVNTGGGLHCYWLLNKPIPVQKHPARFEAALKKIAADLKADPKVCDIAHILRVPCTLNYKYNPPRPVFIESWDPESNYDFEQFVPADFKEPESRHVISATAVRGRVDRAFLIERGRAYLARCPKPVIGEGSDNYTFRICCRLIGTVHPDDIGLTVEEALPLLMEWQPDFDQRWFRQKLHSAEKYARNMTT